MKRLSYLTLALAALLSACEMDNYDEPESILQGRVVYEGQPVSVRQNGVQLELWQDGYQEKEHIPVHVHQDGTYRATLFDGEYKLVRKQNNGPWVNNPDTIRVQLNGSQTLDVPVVPYFIIKDASFTRNGASLTATFRVEQIVDDRDLERVTLFVGTGQFVDPNYNAGRVDLNASEIADLNAPITLTLELPASLQDRAYFFARVGAKTAGVEEMIYTQSQKIQAQ